MRDARQMKGTDLMAFHTREPARSMPASTKSLNTPKTDEYRGNRQSQHSYLATVGPNLHVRENGNVAIGINYSGYRMVDDSIE